MVHGNGRIDLRFTIDQINDVLKSLVVQDGGGGQVSAVGYGSRDPIVKALGSFGINLTANPTLGQLLNQIRGERIEAATPAAITGTIIGVEKKEQLAHADGRDVLVAAEYVNLLTEDGLRSIPLTQVQRIRLLNLALNGELQQALSVLATGHDAQKRTVSIAFEGTGSRPVRVAYIAEAPIWKTTYRLVLDDAHAPFFQGWAIVENSSEADWSDIRLSLVSGRPISFTMDLYQPLYAMRPVVAPELYASLRPRVYGDALDDAPQESKQAALDENRMEMNKPARAQAKSRLLRAPTSPEAGAPAAPLPFTPQQGVSSTAQGQETGELFEYAMTTPRHDRTARFCHAADHQSVYRGSESVDLQFGHACEASLEWISAQEHVISLFNARPHHRVRWTSLCRRRAHGGLGAGTRASRHLCAGSQN